MRLAGRALVAVVVVSVAAALSDAAPASAHGGSDRAVTSNYRTTVDAITPAVTDLEVEIIDADATVQLTYTGPGALVVEGYSGEPYLRVSAKGVERNVRSSATYLNDTRYITAAPPAVADDAAPPEWAVISDHRAVRWHDHRIHWMSTIPPDAVQRHPGRTTVINPDWQIPLLIEGRAVVVHGRLSWIPPPQRSGWVITWMVITVACGGVLWRRRDGRATLAIAAGATTALLLDSSGYVRAAADGSTSWPWVLGWNGLAVVGTAVLGIVVLRPRSRQGGGWRRAGHDVSTVAVSVVALVVAVIGGFDRLDAVTHSQVVTAWPDWVARACAVVCLGAGAALLARVLASLVTTLRVPPSGHDAAALDER